MLNLGPLRYTSSEGVYEEDPKVMEVQQKMERAVLAKARRHIQMLMLKPWQFHKHGNMQHAMSLDFEVFVMTKDDIEKVKEDARREERARIRDNVLGALSR